MKRAFRNEVFPSWTWLGWEVVQGNIWGGANAYLPASHTLKYPVILFFPTQIPVEFADGTSIPWEEGYDDILQTSITAGPPPYLTISGTVFDVGLSAGFVRPPDGVDLRKVKLPPLRDGEWYDGGAYFDHPEAGKPGGLIECIGLLVMVGCADYRGYSSLVPITEGFFDVRKNRGWKNPHP